MRVLIPLLLLVTIPAFAATIEVQPALPTAATPVTLIVEESVSCPPAPQITRTANSFHIVIDPGVCLSPPVNAKFAFPLGALPAGTYQVTVDRGSQRAGQTTFTVRAAEGGPGPIRFDPPNPTSRTPVIAQVTGAINACKPSNTIVSRAGNEISITVVIPTGCDVLPAIIPFTVNVDLGVLPPGTYRVRAAPDRFNVSLGETTLIVQDANPPFTIMPNTGNGSSFDRVRLFGTGIASCDDQPICIPPAVKFGDVLARVDRAVSENELMVEPPGGLSGVVDVTIESGPRTFRHVAGYYYTPFNEKPRPEFYEPVLFPVVFTGPGAYGSRWETEISLDNENPDPLTAPFGTIFDTLCFPICDRRPPARSSQTISGHSVPNGYMMFIPRQAAPNVHFGTLIKDLSRQSEALGTEIPVLREGDLYNRPFHLLNVPSDRTFRVTLRLYDIEGPRTVLVRITKMGSNTSLADLVVTTSGQTPSHFVINDLYVAVPGLHEQGDLRIIVEPQSLPPVTPRTMWGFVSVTNNQTQHVTVISPQ